MPEWCIELLAPAAAELAELPDDMKARFLRIGDLLTAEGPQRVGMPYVRPLGAKLWEMRLAGRGGIARAIYAALPERRLLVLHVFVKKTPATPRRAIDTALQRLKEARR